MLNKGLRFLNDDDLNICATNYLQINDLVSLVRVRTEQYRRKSASTEPLETDTELQTWRECKTSGLPTDAFPNEASIVTNNQLD